MSARPKLLLTSELKNRVSSPDHMTEYLKVTRQRRSPAALCGSSPAGRTGPVDSLFP